MKKLTKKDLDSAYRKLMESGASNDKKCVKCCAPVFSMGGFHGDKIECICMDCEGTRFAEWEENGVQFSGIVDRDGIPILFGPKVTMDDLGITLSNEEARDASKPIQDRLPRLHKLAPELGVVRYKWNPETKQFDRKPSY